MNECPEGRKTMLSSRTFYERIKCLALKMPGAIRASHFMHDEKKRRRQHRDYRPYLPLTIPYRNRFIAIEVFCDPRGDGKGKLFCRVLQHKNASSTNTQQVTLTNRNVSKGGIYFVRPRLDKCGGSLKVQVHKLGKYPAGDTKTNRKFHVGPLGARLLPRVFEVAIAKYDSI
jgi:hypothetical protein